MADLAIRAEGLGKRYRRGRHQAYRTLRDGLLDMAVRLASLHKSGAGSNNESSFLWALREVSFEVRHGETLAIVGRNGAGKSTLLRILARITEPTEGQAAVAGRVGSLLEVGTGFHQELTGRENIQLAGAVMGMRRAEIARRFDEIVAFAGVESHLDTPVKFYSTGMYMRLAFAVAAHLEPDILIVDEVLAVGDAEFQKRCLGKMSAVAGEGRTVLFVSHNMAAARELCTRGLLLEAGRVAAFGSVGEVVSRYLATGSAHSGVAEIRARSKESMASGFRFSRVSVRNPGGESSGRVERAPGVEVQIEYDTAQPISGCHIRLELWNDSGTCVFEAGSQDHQPFSTHVEAPGSHTLCCTIPADFLREGRYDVSLYAIVPNVRTLDFGFRVISFDVIDLSSAEALLREGRRGLMHPLLEWRRVT